jgi:hypothetical protein
MKGEHGVLVGGRLGLLDVWRQVIRDVPIQLAVCLDDGVENVEDKHVGERQRDDLPIRGRLLGEKRRPNRVKPGKIGCCGRATFFMSGATRRVIVDGGPA